MVEKIIGVEESDVGRKYKVRWQGYPGQDSWEREVNVTGARASVEEFWLALDPRGDGRCDEFAWLSHREGLAGHDPQLERF